MSEVPPETPAEKLQEAREHYDRWCDRQSDEFEKAKRAAKKAGEEPPAERGYLPDAMNVKHLAEVATILDDCGVQDFISDEMMEEAGQGDLIDWAMKKLRDGDRFQEFKPLAGQRIVIRWARRAGLGKDGPHKTITPGNVSVVPVADRLAYTGEGAPPAFVFTLSLPFFWLADADTKEWALHSLLCQCGVAEYDKPYKRKPDINASAATLGRYGLKAGWREAAAIAHAMAHPATDVRLREYQFDVATGQGLFWSSTIARQLDITDAKPAKTPARPPRRDGAASRAGA